MAIVHATRSFDQALCGAHIDDISDLLSTRHASNCNACIAILDKEFEKKFA